MCNLRNFKIVWQNNRIFCIILHEVVPSDKIIQLCVHRSYLTLRVEILYLKLYLAHIKKISHIPIPKCNVSHFILYMQKWLLCDSKPWMYYKCSTSGSDNTKWRWFIQNLNLLLTIVNVYCIGSSVIITHLQGLNSILINTNVILMLLH